MANNIVRLPTSYYPDPNQNRPIFNGSVYVGEPDLDPEIEANRKSVVIVQEDGTLVPVVAEGQPLKTGSGGVIMYNGSPIAALQCDGNYSMKVLNSKGEQEYYFPSVLDGVPATVGQVVFKYDVLADAEVDGNLYETATLNVAERTTGNGGSAIWDVIAGTGTANTYDRVAHDTLDLTLVYRVEDAEVNANVFGLDKSGVIDGDAALLAAVDLCKSTGDTLIVEPGMYNAALVIDWCLPRHNVDSLTANPAYDPGTLNQPGYIGLVFNVRMPHNATFMKQSRVERVRGPVTIQGGEFLAPFIMSNLLEVQFKNVRTNGDVMSLTYFSSDPASDRYPLRYAFTFASLDNGSSFWVDLEGCQSPKGIIMGGSTSDGFALNMISSKNCLYTSADSTLHPISGGSESYLDTRGAGVYLQSTSGHQDGMTFINCDFSYGEMPLWNDTQQIVQLIGCYYEQCTVLNAITADGLTPSAITANIQYGFDYDRDDIEGRGNNQRTGLRANTFNLNANPTSEKSTIGIPPTGGAVTFTDNSNTVDIGSFSNKSQQADTGECLVLDSFTNRSGEKERVAKIMGRDYQNYNVSGRFYEEILAPSAAITRKFTCVSGADIGANGTIEITAMGSPNNNSPGTPSYVKGTITKSGAGTWTFTPLIGSLVGTRTTLVIGSSTPNNNSITVELTNDSTGTWTGILHIECNLAAGELTSLGEEIRWNPTI